MSEQSIASRFARSLARAILDANFTDDEIIQLSETVKAGAHQDALVNLLRLLGGEGVPTVSASADKRRERPSVAPTGKRPGSVSTSRGDPKRRSQLSSDDVFDLAKRRKINKNQIFDMMFSVNPSATPSLELDLSIREAISEFFNSTDIEDQSFLVDLIENSRGSKLDPFLRGILDRK